MKLVAVRTITVKPTHNVELQLTLDINPALYNVPQSTIQAQLEALAASTGTTVGNYLRSVWLEPMPALQSVWLLPGANGSVTPFRITGLNQQTRVITAQAIFNVTDIRNLTPEQFAAAGLKPISDIVPVA